MRLSVDRDDQGFDPAKIGLYDAYLDGRKVELCTLADEEQGVVRHHLTDETGRSAIGDDGEWVWIERRGKVELRLRG